MPDARCETTDLLVGHCAHCRPAAPADPFDEPAAQMGPWFYAIYPGECATCGARFEEDEQIRADGRGGYVADCCNQDPS